MKSEIINNQSSVESVSQMSTSKKISFFSAMMIVIGSSIGAGIFFKAKSVLEYSHGSLIFAILSWILAAFAVISMALALVEIASARNDNLSLIGWCKVFNSKLIYKASKNFMTYLYLPLTFFFMPFYFIMTLQDAISAFGGNASNNYFGQSTFMINGTGDLDWIVWSIIAICISIGFLFISGLSTRVGNALNLFITSIKFIPLIAVVILGIVMFSLNPSTIHVSALPTNDPDVSSVTNQVSSNNFAFMSPGIGVFMAMGAIFFAYDGFYVSAGLQTEMKEPKKTPMVILFGLGTVTIIYLVISIIMSLTGNGGIFGFRNWLVNNNALWVFGVLNLTIAIGILGIINGFSMWSPRFIEELIQEKELLFWSKLVGRVNNARPIIGVVYSTIITVPIFIIFSIIGALGYINSYGIDYSTVSLGKLYTFCDLMATWTAVFAFMFVVFPIFGGLLNRKTNKTKIDRKKYFIPFAIISVIMLSVVLIFLFLDCIVNVFLIINNNLPIDETIGRVMKLITLIIFFGVMIIPSYIEIKKEQ